jgi:hypothetical protein
MSSLRTKFFKRHPSERPVGVRIRDLPSNLKTPNFAPFSRSRGDGCRISVVPRLRGDGLLWTYAD